MVIDIFAIKWKSNLPFFTIFDELTEKTNPIFANVWHYRVFAIINLTWKLLQ